MERYVCVHGHFYQPPRENPWLEAIERQDSAHPYHDWNERITVECYAPNATARILDAQGSIKSIVNNYARISFDMGPTLLSWMEANAPDTYHAILEGDKESQQRFSGHGSALAQAYNHIILPLASNHDKRTQVLWGIKDFEHRFKRAPEGMWLPETAVDLESLDLLAENGVRFTILAPHQARRVRRIGSRTWQDVSAESIDPTRPYLLRLPSGRAIAIFFYDGPISRAVAFEGLLQQGEDFAKRLVGAFSEARAWPQIVHIATDGETYGHHHRFGDMALAYALHYIETNGLAKLTTYGEYLERHPPSHQVEIAPSTSWSCPHGTERWRGDCGCCTTGAHPGWNQSWRGPLREALDWLTDTLAPAFERKAGALLKNPWAARDGYIAVVLDRSPERVDAFFQEHAIRPLRQEEKTTALKLLELQRHAMLMYTSCGWFFDDLSGIETVQVVQYASRALQLAQDLFGAALEERFLERLERAKSNVPEQRDGRLIYEKQVKPAVVDWERLGAHFAVNSLFSPQPQHGKIYCYLVDQEDHRTLEVGRTQLIVGRARLTSEITLESARVTFGALHFGGHNVNGGVGPFQGDEAYQTMVQELGGAFSRADHGEVIRLLDKHFGESTYSLKSLFRDEQRAILNQILDLTLADAELVYRQVYEQQAPMMRFLLDTGMPLPKVFRFAAEFFLNAELRRALGKETLELERIQRLANEAQSLGIELDAAGLGYVLTLTLDRIAKNVAASPGDTIRLQRLAASVALARSLPLHIDLWGAQNICYQILKKAYPELKSSAQRGDEGAKAWVAQLQALAERLQVRVD